MAITIDEFKLPITPDEACGIVQRHTSKMGVFLDLDRCYELIGILSRDNFKILRELPKLCGIPSFNPNKRQDVIDTMLHIGVPKRNLIVDGQVSVSAKVLAPLLESGDLDEEQAQFVKMYLKFSSTKNNIGSLNSYTKLPRCKRLSFNGHRMVLARPSYHLLSTSRIQSEDPNMQGIARNYGDIVTYPWGYILIRADSGQIEPRINFSVFIRDEVIVRLITHYNDAYFGLLNFCTMSDAELQACYADFDKAFVPIEITDEIKAKRQDLKTLSNAGSYGSQHLDNIDPALAAAFDRRLVKHPARLARERAVSEQLSRGDQTFYGAFGTPINPGSTSKYDEGGKGWEGHIQRCGINNPVQTTASELMIISVYNADKRLKNATDSGICYYKHDEGAFLVSEKDAEKDPSLVSDLSDITAYNVKGWIPIPADPIIGVKEPTRESYL